MIKMINLGEKHGSPQVSKTTEYTNYLQAFWSQTEKKNLRALYSMIKVQLETRQLVCEAPNPINTTM